MVLYLIAIALLIGYSGCVLVIYPYPEGVEQSEKFQVRLQQDNQPSRNSFVYISRSNNRMGQDKSVKPNRTVSWTSFAFTGTPVKAVVLAPEDFTRCIIRPKQYGINCQKANIKTAIFTILENTKMMSVEFDYDYGSVKSDIVDKLLIFADPPEENVPDANDPNVLFYGPGVHYLGRQLHINETIRHVYLAPGAYVEGGFRTMTPQPVKITGRGVLSGAKYPFHDPRFLWGIINVDIGLNQTVEGITMVDSPQFFYRGQSAYNIVRNVKTVAPWTVNSDGAGIGAYGTIEDSFFQTNDDTFKVYNDGLVVRRCVVWQSQNGAVFQFGWWPSRKARNISISEIDVIHTDWCTFHGDRCATSGNDAVFDLAGKTTAFNTTNVTISNVRVEGECPRIFNFVMDPMAKGTMTKVYLNNWTIEGLAQYSAMDNALGGAYLGGRLASWFIKNMTIENRCIADPSQAKIKIDAKTTRNITFSC
ncbi:hypothetical protein SNE40_016335 [Patella caerulea]|uniref:Uncharacterized protein n=1 Tax=Patella caerulea TaxID=87958 RepID=A0AAN8JDC9_PATCE